MNKIISTLVLINFLFIVSSKVYGIEVINQRGSKLIKSCYKYNNSNNSSDDFVSLSSTKSYIKNKLKKEHPYLLDDRLLDVYINNLHMYYKYVVEDNVHYDDSIPHPSLKDNDVNEIIYNELVSSMLKHGASSHTKSLSLRSGTTNNNTKILDGGFENLDFSNNGWTFNHYTTTTRKINGVYVNNMALNGSITNSPGLGSSVRFGNRVAAYHSNSNDFIISSLNPIFNGNHSMRLGSNINGFKDGNSAESISRKLKVTCENRFLTFRIAQVANFLSHPLVITDAGFFVRVNGIRVLCYHDNTSHLTVRTNIISVSDYTYRNWTEVSVDLSDYVGTTIDLEFINLGCAFSHDIYSYIDDIRLHNNTIGTNYSTSIDTNYSISRDGCRLSVDIFSMSKEDTILKEINSLIDNFSFSSGFKSPPQVIDSTLYFVSIDSFYNFGCDSNIKKYSILYRNDDSSLFCKEIRINVHVNCFCYIPECPDGSLITINPYLNNMAGNWQPKTNFTYNTRRELLSDDNVRSGEYYETYNSIMRHNGKFWSIDDKENWISKHTNELIDFNGKSIEYTNALKIPSSVKYSFNNTLVNHMSSNANAQETFFLSNEDNDMFRGNEKSKHLQFIIDPYNINEIELPLKPKIARFWPTVSYHFHHKIDSVVRSKDEFHTGINSLKVQPSGGILDTGYALTWFNFCESQSKINKGGLSYCKSSPTYGDRLDIVRVKFEDIDNKTDCGSLSGTQGEASGERGAYSDFSKSSVPIPSVNIGGEYPITIDFDVCGASRVEECYVYFDWNQNGDFNSREERYDLHILNNKATRNIKVPSIADIGSTRMRIVYQLSESAGVTFVHSLRPCAYKELNSYGETEDYSVNVVDDYELEAPKNTYTVNDNEVSINEYSIVNEFSLEKDKDYLLSYWVKDNFFTAVYNIPIGYIDIQDNTYVDIITNRPKYSDRPMGIEGWYKIEKVFRIKTNAFKMIFFPTPGFTTYFDDIRIHPLDGSMKGYVYDEYTHRLVSELDENNYATFYDYDEEGQLIRVRKETERGIMTIKESRRNLAK